MGRVKIGLPLPPISVPAPSGTSERHLVVMATGKMDSATGALPKMVTASRRTRPFSCTDITVPVRRVSGVGGSGRPAWEAKSNASSVKDSYATLGARCLAIALSAHYATSTKLVENLPPIYNLWATFQYTRRWNTQHRR